MDVLICGAPDHPKELDKENKTAIYNFIRQHELQSWYKGTNSVATAMKAHPKVQVRHVFKQQDGFSGTSELNFSGDFTWPAQEAGRADAKSALAAGSSNNVRDLFYEWNESEQVRSEHGTVGDFISARTAQQADQFLQ